VHREFDRSRDPLIARQLDDLGKSEAQRREEQTGGGSRMVKNERPQHNLRPSRAVAYRADAQKFQTAWLKEQREAVMLRADSYEQSRDKALERTHTRQADKEPEL
jgi:hypothetical protein